MSDHHERAMLMFAQLASVAAEKKQMIGRNRFLLLTGIAATRAGYAEVAARCHDLITISSPQHIVGHSASFAEALRDADFQTFMHQAEKFCSIEKAEYLLSEMGKSLPMSGGDQMPGDVCLTLLKPLAAG